MLTGYEALCRTAQIRALIDDAISKTSIVVAEQAPAKMVQPATSPEGTPPRSGLRILLVPAVRAE